MLVFIAQHSKGYPLLMSRDGGKRILAVIEDEAGICQYRFRQGMNGFSSSGLFHRSVEGEHWNALV